jgi:magnesium-protoporphyrin O-methyltransferase
VPAREHRAPAIVPLPPAALSERLTAALGADWKPGRGKRVATGFYISEALELRRR